MSIKHAILGLLARGPLHGFKLKAAYEEEVAPSTLTQLNYGQVYTTLDRLREKGLVKAEVVSQEERPDKKVYVLTEAGRKELQEWLQTPSQHDLDLRNETFLKLVLARRLQQGDDTIDPLEVLNVERRACFEQLHEMIEVRAEAEKAKQSAATLLLLDLAVLRLEAFLKWLDRCETLLSEGESK